MRYAERVPENVEHASDAEPAPSAVVAQQLAALAQVSQELASGADLAAGFSCAMQAFDERLGARRCALFLADSRRRTLTVEAAYGAHAEDFRPRYGLGVAGRVAQAGRPIVVPLVAAEPMALSELTGPEGWSGQPLSLVTVPLFVGTRSAGALSVYFEPVPSTGFAARIDWLKVIASVIAQGLRAAHSAPAEDAGEAARARAVFEYANMIGTSAAMCQVYEEIGQVAPTTATVLILGDSGTGKELVAHAIHANSSRASGPFVKINGSAFPESLFESELFGHERGAFTGAVGRKKGRLDRAQGGTLFLDEIGELPLSTQVKLLRVLQFREYERLGGTETLQADVRLVAATNKNMAQAIASGTFREDLFYRLNVFSIALPSLRDRRTDVPALAEYFLEKYAVAHGREVRRFASGALDVLCQHDWPGNVRELENAIERAVVACEGAVVEESHLPKTIRIAEAAPKATERPTLMEAVAQLERQMIESAMRESQGNLARAARALGTTERILRYKVDKHGMGATLTARQKLRA